MTLDRTGDRTRQVVTTPDGRQLCFAEWGAPDGVPVMMLHGTPGGRLFRPPGEPAIAAAGIRLITYDRPGYGGSDRARGRRVVDCVGDVAAILDALGIGHIAVSGGSGGGPHALAVAARLGGRVLRARCSVGIAPYGADGLDFFAGMDPENVKEFRLALAGEEATFAFCETDAAETVERVRANPAQVLSADWELADADRVVLADSGVQAVLREAVPDGFSSGVWGWVDDDLAFAAPWGFDLGEITVPVEVRYGAQDVLVPAAHGAWLGAHVPGARVVVEEGQGHLTPPGRSLALLEELAAGW